MTFWDWWENNRQKTWATIGFIFSVIGGALIAGQFEGILSPNAIVIFGLFCSIMTGIASGGTGKAALENTTRERVAKAAATVEVAKAQQAVAIKSVVETSTGEKP
jgi:hypothetical protein